ncbi:MAG: TolC family protein [Bacteroidaceae bacterium]|nr:TolC family protein [Bacteroidaceae bacterium]
MKKIFALSVSLLLCSALQAQEEGWTLQQCMDYALKHNISLKKSKASEQSSEVSLNEAKAAWFPSLSASLSQNMNTRPFQEEMTSFVNGGITSSASDKTTWSGSYGVSASWTVWNGGQRSLNIKDSQLAVEQAKYSTAEMANSIQEQVAQLYVQILYMREALNVNRELLQHDSIVYERGERMLKNGQISRSDVAQLRAQLSQGRYDVVNAETQIKNIELSLKQVLELGPNEALHIAEQQPNTALIVAPLPAKDDAFYKAMNSRPEVKAQQLSMERADYAVKIAKSAYMPTINLQGNLGDSYMSGSKRDWGQQMKYNFSMSLGLNIQIPIYDKRRTKSSVERAKIGQITAQYDQLDLEKKLYNSIETYWLNASNSQHKYQAALDNVESLQLSYDNTQRQFEQGQKDITDLLSSRGRLLQAKQSLLQDKYTALLNKALLAFYAGQEINF